MKLYKITLDGGEENFYIIANTKYEALGFLIKSDNGITEDELNRLKFWGETEAINGAILS